MKKRIFALFAMMILVLSMVACAKEEPAEDKVSLEKNPVAQDWGYNTDGELTIHFEFPEAGYFNLLAYDATEYQEDIENYPTPKATLFDEKGAALYTDFPIEDGFMERRRFEKGTLTAKITFEGDTEKMERAGLYWAFAPDRDEPTSLEGGKIGAARSNLAGESRFSLNVKQAGLYSITCGEGAVWESDCYLEVFNAAGASVAGRLSIHGTEWTSRSLFLQKGTYDILVSEIQSVATCKAEPTASSDQLILAGSPAAKVPAAIGFSLELPATQVATFEMKDQTRLWVDASGTNAYYDSEQPFTMMVKDESGKIIAEEAAEGTAMVDLKGATGTITVEISNVGNGLVYLILE